MRKLKVCFLVTACRGTVVDNSTLVTEPVIPYTPFPTAPPVYCDLLLKTQD